MKTSRNCVHCGWFAMGKGTISFSGYKFPAIRLTTRCLCVGGVYVHK